MAAEYLYMGFLLGYKEYFGVTGTCTEEEVTEIEEKIGVTFPRSYREVYLILGKHRGFRFIDDNSYKFPQYEEMRLGAEEIMSECETDFVLDKNMFVVGCFIENGVFYFIKLDEGDDPPVYRYEEGDKEYKLAAESCSLFIQQRIWYSGYLLLKEKENKKSGGV